MENLDFLIQNLPDSFAARRFYQDFTEKHPAKAKILEKNQGLLSDVLTISAFSPLLAGTILQHPEYISWLENQRKSTKVRGKEELLESLARFALTNSTLDENILLARFRRRELLRIYLQDIRNLETISEITEEISNLADAILEYALRLARQEMENRFGTPLEVDKKGRSKTAEFCVIALGKLGSKELNYSSDIDLLFLYSADGETSGTGTRGKVSNREFFVKLGEFFIKTVGGPSGEGAAYRVDLRLRPNGRVGALAISLSEALDYYQKNARDWEKQVMIRSRDCAGDASIFRKFYENLEDFIFVKDESVEKALENVRLSKEKINFEKVSDRGFDVKLGRGGIREIEFIAQALQLAHGGRDKWLRVPHTLISLARLADRNLLHANDLTKLAEAYRFLRTLEHRLQMENGLQTHLVPENPEKKSLISRRMGFATISDFDNSLQFHTENVHSIFSDIFKSERIISSENKVIAASEDSPKDPKIADSSFDSIRDETAQIIHSLEKSELKFSLDEEKLTVLETFGAGSPHFAEKLKSQPYLIEYLPATTEIFQKRNYREILLKKTSTETEFSRGLAILRKTWAPLLLEIAAYDVFGKISVHEAKKLQTELAEASIEAAFYITKKELEKRFSIEIHELPFAVLGLGKLGSGSLDYESDLDLILVYDSERSANFTNIKKIIPLTVFYAKAVEIFVNVLSGFTREGNLYRVDLRLRPDGKNGATSIEKSAFFDYMQNRAAIWEWLANVKIRAVGGDLGLAETVENQVRKIIHQRAQTVSQDDLKNETWRIRERLKFEKKRRQNEVNIKFDEGGLLDVYFSVRFLQLRDNVPDADNDRSTSLALKKLFANESMTFEDFRNLSAGYEFLSTLDHHLRLVAGRSNSLPVAVPKLLKLISKRMNFDEYQELLEKLTFHRLNIRHSFENILKK